MEVDMCQINDQLVKTRYKIFEEEINRNFEKKDLARYSSKYSPGLASRTVDRIGYGLIHLGQKLKANDNSNTSDLQLPFDYD
jgi:hypothetical protein